MPSSIGLSTVTGQIAALTITVTNANGTSKTLDIRDMSEIPEAVNSPDCPMLAPKPAGFVTDVSIMRDTYGADASLKTVLYTLTYQFFYCPMEEGVGLFEKYDNMVSAAAIVLNALATSTNGISTDILPGAVPGFGPIEDVSGQAFHGCEITLNVKQYMEN